MKINFKAVGLLLIAFIALTGCSQKIQNPELAKLEERKKLLDQTTQLNNLKLKLEKELLVVDDLSKKVEKANSASLKAASGAKSLSDKINQNPGDLKLSSKANKAASKSASEAKKARKLNDKLGKSNDKVKSLQKDIKKIEASLDDLERKIDFVPNN